MNISKEKASEIALELVLPLTKKILSLEMGLMDIALRVKLRSIPTAVDICFKEHPDYMKGRQSFNVSCYGQWHGVSFAERFPDNGNGIKLEGQDADEFQAINFKIEELTRKKNVLFHEFQQTILSLRTVKRVMDNFPEAAAFIKEKNTCVALAINIDATRDKVRQLRSMEG